MKRLLSFGLLLFAFACNLTRDQTPKKSESDLMKLRTVYESRLEQFDFGEPRDCDTALWAGVAKCGGADVALDEYLYPGDQPQRRTKITCYPTDLDNNGRPDSRSTISSDMVIGLSMCDRDIAKRILVYAKFNDWFIGEPRSQLGEVVLKPNVQIVLEGRDTPTVYAKPGEDYQYHIQVLLIHWEGNKYGKISQNALERLEDAVQAYPDDYLFQAVLGKYRGNMDTAIKLLLAGVNPSSYVRGSKEFPMANWLMAAKIVLEGSNE